MATATETPEQTPEKAADERAGAASESTALTAPEEKPPNRTGLMGFGIAPKNFDEAWRMATVFSKSQLVPKDYRGRPEDIIVAMQHGAEVGLAPLQSLQSIAVINGRPSIWGDGMLALVKASPLCVGHDEYYLVAGEKVARLTGADLKNEETTAVCRFWRRGRAEPFENSFSIGQAARSGLLSKKETPWQNYPERMLMMRARSWAARDAFPDVLKGLTTVEEAMDIPEVETVNTMEPPREPIRRSEKLVGAGSTAPAEPVAPAAEPALTNELPPEGGKAVEPAATSKPAAKPANAAGPPLQSATGTIGETKYVTPPQGQPAEPYYEVQIKVGKTTVLYVTRDEQLAQILNSCEGSDRLYKLSFVQGTHAGKPVRWLKAIVAAD